MFVYIVFLFIWTLNFQRSSCLNLIDLPLSKSDIQKVAIKKESNVYQPIAPETRRYFLAEKLQESMQGVPNIRANGYEDEKDTNLKMKISTLVQQTVHDTERKIKSIQHIKDLNRETAPYKAGFILSMIKKSRDVLNELFNVAVKHKDEWKALEQLKIFELIVHTNVDTTNLVRQLVEIHIQHLNATNPENNLGRRRIVIL